MESFVEEDRWFFGGAIVESIVSPVNSQLLDEVYIQRSPRRGPSQKSNAPLPYRMYVTVYSAHPRTSFACRFLDDR